MSNNPDREAPLGTEECPSQRRSAERGRMEHAMKLWSANTGDEQ